MHIIIWQVHVIPFIDDTAHVSNHENPKWRIVEKIFFFSVATINSNNKLFMNCVFNIFQVTIHCILHTSIFTFHCLSFLIYIYGNKKIIK
jgi:hypothetical protein